MNVKIYPSVPSGTVEAPPSKSMAHRLLICAGLSAGTSVISNISYSQDVLATIDCLRALGAEITTDGSTVTVTGIDTGSINANGILPCRECGSTLRFFIPICLLSGNEITLTGSERLLERPQTVYEEICKQENLLFNRNDKGITVCGPLKNNEYSVDGGISSQFISGLMFALAICKSESRIHITGKVESRPYIELTISAMNSFGVNVSWENDNTILIPAGSAYKSCDMTVEGDWSNAAFFEAMSLIGDVKTIGCRSDSLQGDKVCVNHLKNLHDGYCDIDISDCPDLGPVLFATAAFCKGAHFTGTRRLRIKESDRVEAMKQELEKFGTVITAEENDVYINSSQFHKPIAVLESHNDHRIAMALSVLLAITGGTITGTECTSKSMPDFFTKLQSLGVELQTDET